MRTQELAWRIRRDVVEMTHNAGAAHVGSCLSVADILAVLYNDIMRIFPDDPQNDGRDRLIMSKGHGAGALYAVLAEKGYFPKKDLEKHCMNGSFFSGLACHYIPGVEFSGGTLGMGLSVADGIALSCKWKCSHSHVYTILGDGECNEGAIWEAAMFAGHNMLSNLTAIVDNNNLQANDSCENVISWRNIYKMWESFGWHVLEANGHDVDSLRTLLRLRDGIRPTCLIAHTIKGKGVSFMENEKIWHYSSPQGDAYRCAIEELEERHP